MAFSAGTKATFGGGWIANRPPDIDLPTESFASPTRRTSMPATRKAPKP